MAVTVMLVGIGFAALLIGAIAERFFHREIEDVELTEEDVLAQVRAISVNSSALSGRLSNGGE